MVDIMVAAEALYLSGSETQELGFRLALRASALSNPDELGMTRRDLFDLMKVAYIVRSKIVHGDVPKPKDLKVKGASVSLPEFVQATEGVVRQGLRRALSQATDSRAKWPPDWDAMTLPT
jgi:Apea-like HEPN